MPETIRLERVSMSGPLQQVNAVIGLPRGDYGEVVCPSGLTLRQKQRLLLAAKKQINAELYETYKTLELINQVRTM